MKVQVNLSDDLVKKIDAYTDAIGQTRSGFCAGAIGEKWFQIELAMSKVNDVANNLVQQLSNNIRSSDVANNNWTSAVNVDTFLRDNFHK